MTMVYPLEKFAIYAEDAKLWVRYPELFTTKDGTFGLFPQWQLGGETGTGGGMRIFHTNGFGREKILTAQGIYSGDQGKFGEGLYVDPNLLGTDLIWKIRGGYLQTKNNSANINGALDDSGSRLFELKKVDAETTLEWRLKKGEIAPFVPQFKIVGMWAGLDLGSAISGPSQSAPFLYQLFVTPWVLRRFGVSGALFFLPISMALGALGVLLVAGLWGGVAVKVGDVGFRHSIHKSAVEVLFFPIPSQIKKQSKVFLDATVDNLATGLGAILVLVLQGGFGILYPHLSFLSLGLIAVWMWSLLRLRGAYVNAFRLALDHREIRPDDFRAQLNGTVIEALIQALKSENPRQVAYALELLGTTDSQDLTSEIAGLIQHPDADVRRLALLAMRPSPYVDLQPLVRGLLHDENTDVRVEALHFLRRYLQDSDPKIRTAALGYISSVWQ